MPAIRITGLILSALLLFGCATPAADTPDVSETPLIDQLVPSVTAEPEISWRSYLGQNPGNLSDAVMEAVIRARYTGYGTRSDEMCALDFYAAEPFDGGVVVLFEEQLVGETAPNLCYVKDGEAVGFTTHADCWSINVSRLSGKTLVFGRALTAEPAVTSVTATFEGGSKADAKLFSGTAAPQNAASSNPAVVGEVFLIGGGEAPLSGIEFFSGETSIGNAASDAFRQTAGKDAVPLPWAGTQHELYDRIRFCPMQTGVLPQDEDAPLLLCSSYAVSMTAAKKRDMLLSDIWCSNLGGAVGVAAENGSVALERLPEDMEAVYFLLPGTNDDELGLSGDRIVQTAVKDGRIAMPENVQNMRLRLVLETKDCYYIATVLCA